MLLSFYTFISIYRFSFFCRCFLILLAIKREQKDLKLRIK
ncbi:hypothetical protein HMPREF3218_0201700 [Prevotella bivia]|uniref:Uncharacterized protein n=1 Tax=Prevotella bivia TaxID=28125 RepID=A0A137SS57_9BACT|nr:hypothetical protein HMPREF3202_01889 [Prevotella bivia]KXU56989.1 hypothetical protein HMPREF3218_0201700 [Prevotella bivia]